MGKWTDKNYITHSEWMRDFGGIEERKKDQFRRLPYNFCSLSLQPAPLGMAMCSEGGSVYNVAHLAPFLRKYGVDPVTGKKASMGDYFKVHFHVNQEGAIHCPSTLKSFNENSKIVVIKTTGNVFSHEAVERLNAKMGYWKDLINDEPFKRADIVMLQDPMSLGDKYNFATFYHVKNNLKVNKEEEEALLRDPNHFINFNSATRRILDKLEPKESGESPTTKETAGTGAGAGAGGAKEKERAKEDAKETKRLEAHFSTGQVSSSFTSTAMTVATRTEMALRDPDEVMYDAVKKAGKKGYARIVTNYGDLNLELHCDLVSQMPFFSFHFSSSLLLPQHLQDLPSVVFLTIVSFACADSGDLPQLHFTGKERVLQRSPISPQHQEFYAAGRGSKGDRFGRGIRLGKAFY